MTSISFMIAELGDGRYHDGDKLECDVRKNTLPTADYENKVQVSQGRANRMRQYTFSLNP